jgi:DNA primase
MGSKCDVRIYELDGIEVRLSNPDKVYFPKAGLTNGPLADFYVANADAVLNHLRERPTMLKRYAGGIEEQPFYQTRVPAERGPTGLGLWVEVDA